MAGRFAELGLLAVALAGAVCAVPVCLAHDTESFFRLELPQGEIHGTELIPHIDEAMPCVVILGGAVSQDRDGRLLAKDAPPRDALRRLAEALQAGGYASVRYDRVGYGRSKPGPEWTGRSTDAAAVAAAVIEAARKRRDFTKVIVLAEHEGTYVACLAAKAGAQPDGYILLGARSGAAGQPARDQVGVELSADMLKLLSAPVLALAGSADRHVPPEHASMIAAALKAAGNKDATSRLIEGADYHFQRAATNEADQAREHADRTSVRRPYEAKAYHAILEWLYARFPTPAEGRPEQVEQIAARATPESADPAKSRPAFDNQP